MEVGGHGHVVAAGCLGRVQKLPLDPGRGEGIELHRVGLVPVERSVEGTVRTNLAVPE